MPPVARTQRPGTTTPRVMAVVVAAAFVVGGLAGSVAATDGPHVVARPLLGLGGGAVLVGLGVARWGARLPPSAYHAIFGAGSVLICTGTILAPTAVTAVAISGLFTFVALLSFFSFPWPQASVHLLGAVALCFSALLSRPGVPSSTWLVVSLCCVGVAVVVGALQRRATSAGLDTVTDLANRRGFDEVLEEMLRESARSDDALGAALLDLDHFKEVNDTRGHAAGDQLLRRLGQRWSAMVPPGAVLARYGGDEFALLLPGLDAAASHEVVERLRSAAEVGLSCGVTAHRPGETASQLMRRADRALYQAKSAGRGRSVVDEDSAGDGLAAALTLALDLAERADGDGGLQVVYQPIVSLEDHRVVGVEALARWTHPDQGPVSPARFVPAAETAGLVSRLGSVVARQAFADLAELRRLTGRRLLLTVNVSGLQLTDPAFPAMVQDALARSGWEATSTVLEVTESLVDAESSLAVSALTALRASGLRVAIDDFGTGYSALSRLDTLPTDYLKLDCSFVAPVATSPRRAQMIESILLLAGALDLAVIAEGVETDDQARALRSLGCSLAQGYHFHRPGPLSAVARALGHGADPAAVPADPFTPV